jgi:hypothetical protein
MALALGLGGFLPGLTIANPAANALSVIFTAVAQVLGGWFFLIFPSGRFVPRRSRWCVLAAAAGMLIVTAPAIARGQPAVASGQTLGSGLLLLGIGGQVYRYRRVSTLTERQQAKWVVVGLLAGLALIVVSRLLYLALAATAQFQAARCRRPPSWRHRRRRRLRDADLPAGATDLHRGQVPAPSRAELHG